MRSKMALLSVLSVVLLSSGIARAQSNSDVTFDTLAMTYPQGKKIKVSLIGTERFAKNIKGEATVERRKSVTLIQIDIGRLPPPSQLGPAFATYVIWAITPEGQADNIGEYRQRGSETLDNWFGSEISTSTPHRTFSLIITAEPYHLVTSPSRLVVVANQGVKESNVTSTSNSISFAGDGDFERVLVTPDPTAAHKDTNYPIELLQARRALDIARYYEAESYAQSLLDQARTAYERGDQLYQEGKRDEARESADLAIRLGDRARSLSVSRKKAKDLRDAIAEKDDVIAKMEDDLRNSTQSSTDLQATVEEEKRRRRALEQENDRLLKDLEIVRRETEMEKNATRNERSTVTRLQNELVQLREDLEKAQGAARVAERERQVKELREQVVRQFENRFDNRGLVIIIPDGFFGTEQSTSLGAEASFKLEPLINLLRQTTNSVIIEAYTDNRGAQDARFKFTQGRAQAVLNFLIARGIPTERVQAFANGGSNPRSDNRTPQGRTANRRVELIIVEANTQAQNK